MIEEPTFWEGMFQCLGLPILAVIIITGGMLAYMWVLELIFPPEDPKYSVFYNMFGKNSKKR